MKRLYKSSTNKQIMGVCGGLAEYFNIDVTAVRLIFGIAFFVFGVGFMPYMILAFILPYDYQVNASSRPFNQTKTNDGYVYRNRRERPNSASFSQRPRGNKPKDVTPVDEDVWSDF
ncbi:PspC domain-containing protein [Globicatella sulfidifaciens]